jgi:GNAT superfamily N-acetyltransferase
MNPLTIRLASITDVSSIVEVKLGALSKEELSGFSVPEGSIYSSTKMLQKAWQKDNKLEGGFEMFVAECKGEVIGFISYNMTSCDDNIDNLIVAREQRGKGVGRALVEYVETLAKSRGYDVMRTDTTENATGVPWKAYGFWERMGYKDTGERMPSGYNFKVIPLVKKLK